MLEAEEEEEELDVGGGGSPLRTEEEEGWSKGTGGVLAFGSPWMGEVKGDSMMVEGVRLVEKRKREGRWDGEGVGRLVGVD